MRHHALWWIFLIALVARLAFVGSRSDDLGFPDERDYDAIARNVVREGRFQETDGRRASRAPGYPLALAALYSLGLRTPRAVFAVQAFAGALTCVLIALLGRRWFGDTAGVIAGWLAAFYPFFIYFAGLLLTETFFILGIVTLFLLLEWVFGEGALSPARGWALVGAGVVAGALIHLRSSFLFFPLFVLPFLLLRATPRLRALGRWGVILAVAVLALSPWVWRNYRVFGRVIVTTLQGGESLYEANSPYADGGPMMDRIPWDLISGGPLGEVERDAFFREQALRYIRENPRRFAELGAKKFKRFWNIVPNHPPYRRGVYAVGSVLSYVPVMILGVMGVLWQRGRKSRVLYALSPILYYTAVHVVFVGSIRYRLAVMPFVLVLAGAGAEPMWVRAREVLARRWKRALCLALALMAVAAAGGAYRWATDPERLRQMSERRLAELAGGAAQVSSARFEVRNGLVLGGVRLRTSGMALDSPAIEVGAVILRPDWGALVRGNLVWRTVEMEDVAINAEFDREGHWRFLKQISMASSAVGKGGAAPTIHVSRVHIRLSGLNTGMGGLPALALADVNAELVPDESGGVLKARIWSEQRDLGRPTVRLWISTATRVVKGRFSLAGLTVDSHLRDLLPAGLRRHWDIFKPVEAQLDAGGDFTWDGDADRPFHIEGDIAVYNGAFTYRHFPYAVSGLRADVHVNDRAFRVGRVRAVVEGALVSGSGQGRVDEDGRLTGDLTLRAGEVAADARLGRLLPKSAAAVWERIAPGGKVNLIAEVKLRPGAPTPDVFLEAELLDCTCTVPGLGVPFTDIRGGMTYAAGRVTLRGITGKVGRETFRVYDGFAQLAPGGPFRLGVECRRLPLDVRAGRLLPALVRERMPSALGEVLADAHLKGAVRLSVSAHRARDDPRVRFAGRADLLEVSCSHPRLALPLSRVSGSVAVTEDAVKVAGITGRWGRAGIRVPEFSVAFDPRTPKRMAVHIQDLPIDKRLFSVLPGSVARGFDTFRPAGILDVHVVATRPAGEAERFTVKTVTHLREGRFRYEGFPYPVEKVSGEIEMNGASLERADLRGVNGSTKVAVKIRSVPLNGRPGRVVEVHGLAGVFDKRLYGALSDEFRKVWDLLKPRGELDVSFTKHFQTAPWRPDVFVVSTDMTVRNFTAMVGAPVAVPEGTVTLADCMPQAVGGVSYSGRVRLGALAARGMTVRDVRAGFASSGEGLVVREITGELLGGSLRGELALRGSAGRETTGAAPKGQGFRFRGQVGAAGIEAAALGKRLGATGIGGRLDVKADFSGELGKGDALRDTALRVEVVLQDLTADFGTPVKVSGGTVSFPDCRWDAKKGFTAAGRCALASVQAMGLETTGVEADYASDNKGLTVRNITGNFHGGKLAGALSVPWAGKGEGGRATNGTVEVVDADAESVARVYKLDRVAGRLDVTGAFRGELAHAKMMHCRGALTVREGAIGSLPGVLNVLHLLRLRRLDAPAFHRLELDYEFMKGEFIAHQFNLYGDALTLYGASVVGKDKKTYFRFRPELVPEFEVPGIGETLNVLKDALMPVTLRGSGEKRAWRLEGVLRATEIVADVIEVANPLRVLKVLKPAAKGQQSGPGEGKE